MKCKLTIFTLILAFAGISGYANSSEYKKRVLISVGSIKENSEEYQWKKSTCNQVYTIANQVVDSGADVTCRNLQTESIIDSGLKDMHKNYDFHIRILKSADNTIGIDVTNLHRTNQSDFKSLGWKFKDGEKSKVSKEDAMAKALGNFFYYVNNEEAFKAGLLVNGMNDSDQLEYDQNNGLFRDRLTNEPLSIKEAYKVYEKESERHINYLRTGVEIGVLLSSAMAVYYKNLVYNQVDFDYTLKEGINKKLTGEAIRFDDNDKYSNYGHVYAGVLYYQMARSNGFNSLESFLVAFASSTTWEFMEYHEVLSINDEILTPVGGYVIGEATYQLSCALLQKDSIAAKALGYTINPGLAINNGIDKLKKSESASKADCSKPRFSDISTYIGLDSGKKAYKAEAQKNYIAGMDATVVNIDGYEKLGKEKKLVYDTALTKILVEVNGYDGAKDLKVIAQVVAAAYYQKDLSRDEKGQLRGYDIILGLGSASTWSDRGAQEDSVDAKNEDFYGTVNILGATAHANIHYKGSTLKIDFGFYGDFAMVKSYSLSKFTEANPNGLSGQATTISEKGYYWGYGTSSLGAIALQRGNWEVGFSGQLSNAKSIEGGHRKEEEITAHDKFKDTLSSSRIYVRYQLTKKIQLQLSKEFNVRTGSVNNDFNSKGTETRTTGTLIYKF